MMDTDTDEFDRVNEAAKDSMLLSRTKNSVTDSILD